MLALTFTSATAQTADGPSAPEVFVDTTYRAPSGAIVNVPSGGDVQAALNSAQPGDTIVLAQGATYVAPYGGLVLPNKSNPNNLWIVVRTSNLAGVPVEGMRVKPSLHASAMPKLITPNGSQVLRTSSPVHHYRFVGIEFGIAKGNLSVSSLIAIGKDGSSQDTLSEVPHHIIFDRCYIHGNTVGNARHGVVLNSAYSAVIDSHISDFHHSDGAADSQAILGWNGPGPFKIVNNYLEAASENIMFGGADPTIPNLIPSDIEIRRNHFYKPTWWKDYILKTPSGLSGSGTGASGNLSSGVAYYYQVVALGSVGSAKVGTSSASSELRVTLASTQKAVSLSWSAVSNATEYRVYRTSDAPGTSRNWTYYISKSTSFTDTNAAGTTGSSPASTATKWVVKNLLEIKNGQRILIDGNLFENNWRSGQTGDALLIKSINQGLAPWSVAQDIQITNNRIRHAGGGVNIQGHDTRPSGRTKRISLANNLFEDIGGIWGTGNLITITGEPTDLIFDHNTAFHANLALLVDGGQVLGFKFSNNLMPHNKYGVKGSGRGTGTDTLTYFFPGYVFLSNVLAGGRASLYPPFNFFPTSLSTVGFVDFSGGDFRLSSTSLYKNAGSDGKDVGCDIDALKIASGIAP
ncbi:MAG: hypothetical protein WKF84_04725 [Pyrinomonadaceae bacterium]